MATKTTTADVVLESNMLERIKILDEEIYLVASDHLLETYFPLNYPQCKESMKKGVDFAQFEGMPFITTPPSSPSRRIIDEFLRKNHYSINIYQESNQHDIHHHLSKTDDIASFCLQMYARNALNYNLIESDGSPLNIFPIKNFTAHNRVVLAYHKDIFLPHYKRDIIQLTIDICRKHFAPLRFN